MILLMMTAQDTSTSTTTTMIYNLTARIRSGRSKHARSRLSVTMHRSTSMRWKSWKLSIL